MFETNDETVLKLTSAVPESNPAGLNGQMPWVRRITYSTTQNRTLKMITVRA